MLLIRHSPAKDQMSNSKVAFTNDSVAVTSYMPVMQTKLGKTVLRANVVICCWYLLSIPGGEWGDVGEADGCRSNTAPAVPTVPDVWKAVPCIAEADCALESDSCIACRHMHSQNQSQCCVPVAVRQ